MLLQMLQHTKPIRTLTRTPLTTQVLSVIEMVPEAYKRELAVLQQGVPPKPLHEITAMIEAGLGKKVHEVFAWLDETPLGAASIGQVRP
jgi:predicted unusual protein kinase regulating ubiquinone biosynthesis (AarF/ABC1/UbiB family)